MTIYFKPTYLYIKQHSVTGKLYFGKTTQNPEKYSGSGLYWKNHITKHGKEHVVTLWYCLFYDRVDCVAFARNFSIQENIVNSENWANLKLENGTDGGSYGIVTSKTREKLSKAATGRNKGKSYVDLYGKEKAQQRTQSMRESRLGVLAGHRTAEAKQKMSIASKGKAKSKDHAANIAKSKEKEKHPMFNKTHSIETKQRMSASQKARAEQRRKN